MCDVNEIINELELLLLMKKIKLELDQTEIDRLKQRIETIEHYMEEYIYNEQPDTSRIVSKEQILDK